MPEAISVAEPGHGFSVADVGVDVLEADLAADIGGSVGSLEQFLEAAVIHGGFAHETHSVAETEFGLDEFGVTERLPGREELGEDGAGHRQEPVADARDPVGGVQ